MKVPRSGYGKPMPKSVEPKRDIKIVSRGDYKLRGNERMGRFGKMKQDRFKHFCKDAVGQCGQAAVAGAVLFGAVACLYAGSDLAKGNISGKEVVHHIAKEARTGAGIGLAASVVDTACQAGGRALASKAASAVCTVASKCVSKAVPIAGAVVGVAVAAHNLRNGEPKEAVASCLEAGAGVAATVAVVALECSGPVGWAILGAGTLLGWGVRVFA